LVFKGNSAQYLAQVIDEVVQLARSGAIYPPTFATWREPELENGLSSHPHDRNEGRLSPAEAVAIRVLADEGSAIAQNLFESTEKTRLINEIVGTPDGWPSDVVDGMADFGYQLRGALRIRDRIARGEAIPAGKTIGESLDRRLWERYVTPLKLDGMSVRGNTVTAVAEETNSLVDQQIRGNPEGARNEKELQDRMRSRRRGIELGSRVYKQVLDVAMQRGLPATLDRTINVTAVPPAQISAGKK